MSNESQYLSNQIQRTLKAINLMAGHEVNGIAPNDLAKALDTSLPNVTRVLINLKHGNFAETLPSNPSRWRLSPALVQITNTVELNIRQAIQQLDIDQRNYRLLSH